MFIQAQIKENIKAPRHWPLCGEFTGTGEFLAQSRHDILPRYLSLWTHLLISCHHYNDIIMGAKASQITSLTIAYSTVYSGTDQRKHQSSASLAIVRGIHRWPVNSPHRWSITRKMFSFNDVIVMPSHVMPFPVMPLCNVLHTTSHHLIYHIIYHSYNISYHITWYYITSHHVIHNIIANHISYHIS